MKHTFREFLIILIALVGGAYLYRLYARARGPLVRVIAFHDVADSEWFSRTITFLKSRYAIVTPQEFMEGKFHPDRINILITFDDGYTSWVETCLPILEREQVKALFFVNSGLLDVAKDPEGVAHFVRTKLLLKDRRILSWEGLQALVTKGHTIGGHSMNHAQLSALSHIARGEEVYEDKKKIQTHIGKEIAHFAYPFGTYRDYSVGATEHIRTLGYHFIYSAEPGWYRPHMDLIPRTLIEDNQSIPSLVRFIQGSYDILSYLKRGIRRYNKT